MDLTSKQCVPCKEGTPPLQIDKIKNYLKEVPDWFLVGDKIIKEYRFKDFRVAMKFVNQIADLAEKEGHHPDINIVYNRVKLSLFTHVAKGLTENDFILAAKINKLNS